ncbi:2'-5' RNA ligase family protein [Bacillus salacetis]|uniref:2'-5' RNA ligase family protein n=1 Tax=Bacillus salacetis TaxID=2315464 RepID=UPI0023E7D518|nr:2'-5' RNA ligase family protein [Bacillus salacetis]
MEDETSFAKQLEDLYKYMKPIKISFNSVGSFFESGALYLSPVMTTELYELHCKHHQVLQGYGNSSSPFYLPGQWVPHCTIANRLSSRELAEAYSYCINRIHPLSGEITKIALIKVQGSAAPVIHSTSLKEADNCSIM